MSDSHRTNNTMPRRSLGRFSLTIHKFLFLYLSSLFHLFRQLFCHQFPSLFYLAIYRFVSPLRLASRDRNSIIMPEQSIQALGQVPVFMPQPTNLHVQQRNQKKTSPQRWSAFRMTRKTFSIYLLALVSALLLASILELIFMRLAVGEYRQWPEYEPSNDLYDRWTFATSASPDKLQIGSACTALVLAAIYGAMTVYSLKKGPIKITYCQRLGFVVALGLGVVLAVTSAIYTLVLHASSDHLDYAQALASANKNGIIDNPGTFDVDTWACEVASLPTVDTMRVILRVTYARTCAYRTGVRSLCAISSILSIVLLGLVWRDWKREKWLLRTWKTQPTWDSDSEDDL
ncbi:hypothetical protein BJ170DRAFT_630590, partial [Xylariales sp. AK1849]